MSAFDRYGRLPMELPDLLTDIAAPTIPDYVDDVLAITVATRQRPRWTFPERWLPMAVISRDRVNAPPFPWRLIVAVGLVIVLIAAALAFAGARHQPPPPFGPARNGALLFGDGDIQVRDAVDGTSRVLVGGPTNDFAANFTRDGSHLVFLRRVAGSAGSPDERIAFVVANADGSNPRQVSEGLVAPDWWDLAPDDRSVVVESGDSEIGKTLYTVDLIGNGGTQPLDVGDPRMTMSTPNFLGPDGKEIVFRGRTSVAAGRRAGIFAVKPDGTGLRALTPTDGELDAFYLFPRVSEDGRLVTYTDWEAATSLNSIHIVDLRAGSDRVLDRGTQRNEGFASFSPDSRSLAFEVYNGPWNYVMVEPVDRSSGARQVGPKFRMVDGSYLTWLFSPDAKSILIANEGSKESRLVDLETGGEGRVIDWAEGDTHGWQRLAP
jgi:Tol biopolymer transport system component